MLIVCPKCGKSISDTSKTCIHCGEILSNYIICPECKNLCKSNSDKCLNCGYNFAAAAKYKEEKIKQEIEIEKNRQIELDKERKSRNCRDCLYYLKEGISNCSMYRYNPFHHDAPKCPYYSYSSMAHENNKCYLTTACVEYYGKPDDCYELQKLRNFRDSILMKTEEGRKLCEEYYRIAPSIVEKIHKINNSAYYEYIYAQILVCIKLIDNQEFSECVTKYKEMCLKLQNI